MRMAARLKAYLDMISSVVVMVLEVVDKDMLYNRTRLKLIWQR